MGCWLIVELLCLFLLAGWLPGYFICGWLWSFCFVGLLWLGVGWFAFAFCLICSACLLWVLIVLLLGLYWIIFGFCVYGFVIWFWVCCLFFCLFWFGFDLTLLGLCYFRLFYGCVLLFGFICFGLFCWLLYLGV